MHFKKLLLVLTAVVLTLGCCEGVLRLFGYRPGSFKKLEGFELVDSLIIYKNFTTDEAGIYKFSPWVTDSLSLYFDCKTGTITNREVDRSLFPVDHIDYILQSFCRIHDPAAADGLLWKCKRWMEHEPDSSELVNAYQKAFQQRPDNTDEWAAAILEYVHHPYNKDGFRSIAFRQYHSKRKKVLLIGDSFVYGMAARPLYNCFADILLARGYLIYSAGIPGTDPAQYAAIAQKYAPLLKPDIVMVCFYEGNDYMHFARIPALDQPHEHVTNAGFFESAPLGTYLDPQQAYTYYSSLITIPAISTSRFNRFCSHSAIGGLVWGTLFKMDILKHRAATYADSAGRQFSPDTAFTASRIRIIDSICRVQSVALKVIVIPQFDARHNEKRHYLTIDKELADRVIGKDAYYTPHDLIAKEDFRGSDYHFNNQGSLKFANFIDSILNLPLASGKESPTEDR